VHYRTLSPSDGYDRGTIPPDIAGLSAWIVGRNFCQRPEIPLQIPGIFFVPKDKLVP
jgi:hypothetical protein